MIWYYGYVENDKLYQHIFDAIESVMEAVDVGIKCLMIFQND